VVARSASPPTRFIRRIRPFDPLAGRFVLSLIAAEAGCS
jgi:hypothetical protein